MYPVLRSTMCRISAAVFRTPDRFALHCAAAGPSFVACRCCATSAVGMSNPKKKRKGVDEQRNTPAKSVAGPTTKRDVKLQTHSLPERQRNTAYGAYLIANVVRLARCGDDQRADIEARLEQCSLFDMPRLRYGDPGINLLAHYYSRQSRFEQLTKLIQRHDPKQYNRTLQAMTLLCAANCDSTSVTLAAAQKHFLNRAIQRVQHDPEGLLALLRSFPFTKEEIDSILRRYSDLLIGLSPDSVWGNAEIPTEYNASNEYVTKLRLLEHMKNNALDKRISQNELDSTVSLEYMDLLEDQVSAEIQGMQRIESIFANRELATLQHAASNEDLEQIQASRNRNPELIAKLKSDLNDRQKDILKLSKYRDAWFASLPEVFRRERELYVESGADSVPSHRRFWARLVEPFLFALSDRKYVDIIENVVDELLTKHEAPLFYVQHLAGYGIMRAIRLQVKVDLQIHTKLRDVHPFYEHRASLMEFGRHSYRSLWFAAAADAGYLSAGLNAPELRCPRPLVTEIGDFVFSLIYKHLTFRTRSSKESRVFELTDPEEEASDGETTHKMLQVFYTPPSKATQMKAQRKVILRPYVYRLQQRAAPYKRYLSFASEFFPSLVKPSPWLSSQSGGGLLHQGNMVRSAGDGLGAQLAARTVHNDKSQNQLPVMDSLSALSCLPWSINKAVLNAQIEVFCEGTGRLKIPPAMHCLPDIPQMTEDDKTDEESRRRFRAKRKEIVKMRAENFSLWCTMLYRLSIADHYRDRHTLYFPTNIDFRGRTYPIPPYFNHQGDDAARGLLMFADKKPLGTGGLDWLILHCVNLTGKKKRSSLRERLAFGYSKLPEIVSSAENQLDESWWQESEEPWQTLATCIEIRNALKLPSPSLYECGLPVHQDGSCNGLQHYAAMGLDTQGARDVNLSDSLRPQDVYSGILALVHKRIAVDKEDTSLPVYLREMARVLSEGRFVVRKTIKQTVMTVVYGVTYWGAKEQIFRQIDTYDELAAALQAEVGPHYQAYQSSKGIVVDFASPLEEQSDSEDSVNVMTPSDPLTPPSSRVLLRIASMYLSKCVLESVGVKFERAALIQVWLAQIARLAARQQLWVQWRMPMGLPVLQPYSKQIRLPTSKAQKAAGEPTTAERPHTIRQSSAFPPNFVHSLDSAHMMLTALHCRNAGVTFASIHDCFWTHPSSVNEMNRICREQFVHLHTLDPLKRLSKEWQHMYREGSEQTMRQELMNQLKQIPQKGDFDLQDVLKSVYFFC